MGLGKSPLLLASFLVTQYAWAKQDESVFDLSLDELLITTIETASKYQEPLSESPAVSTVITRDEITAFGANNLYEILERVAGVYMTGSNFFPQNVMAMRGDLLGHYDNHILTMLNGRPLRESYAGGVNFAIYTALPVSIIERIEVIRGPGSVLYGTNAYSGVVNIITRETEQQKLTLTAGSFDTHAAEWFGSAATPTFSANWGVKYFNEKGWTFSATDNNGVLGSTDYGEDNLGIFLDVKSGNFRFNALYLDSDQDFIGASVDWGGVVPVNERSMRSKRAFVDVSHKANLSDSWQVQSHLSWSDMEFDHYNYLATAHDTNLEVTSFWRPSNNLNWIFGATMWWQEVGSQAGLANAPVPDFSATWYTLYSQIDYKLIDELKLVGGLQWNKADNLASDTVSRLGATYQLSDNWGIKLMRAEAYRAAFGVETGFSLILRNPDGSVRGGLRGNPDLLPEKITTTDLQLFYHSDALQAGVTFFRSELSDLITRERASDNVIDFVNKGELSARGWEFEAKYNVSERWYLNASYSYQTNHTPTIKNYTTVPNNFLKMGIIYQPHQGTSYAVYLNDVGEATDIAVQNPNRSAYNPNASRYQQLSANVTLNLGQYWPALTGYSVSLYGYNLLDENIYQSEFIGKRVNTLPARAGRSWYLSFAYKF